MKIEIELTPELEEWALFWDGVSYSPSAGLKQIQKAVEKAKNQINIGTLVRYCDTAVKDSYVTYFICTGKSEGYYESKHTDRYEIEGCKKATPGEEKLIRLLLEHD